ncbi:hypothetical protein T492DRAFT_866108 [Pavlovales sp. CCMP2436]|nr:hypothetical protein T492DRAFT_866108 [Pavlovales sp. CCMP2436]
MSGGEALLLSLALASGCPITVVLVPEALGWLAELALQPSLGPLRLRPSKLPSPLPLAR